MDILNPIIENLKIKIMALYLEDYDEDEGDFNRLIKINDSFNEIRSAFEKLEDDRDWYKKKYAEFLSGKS